MNCFQDYLFWFSIEKALEARHIQIKSYNQNINWMKNFINWIQRLRRDSSWNPNQRFLVAHDNQHPCETIEKHSLGITWRGWRSFALKLLMLDLVGPLSCSMILWINKSVCSCPDGCLNRFKITVNRFRESQRVWWYDSRRNDTIKWWLVRIIEHLFCEYLHVQVCLFIVDDYLGVKRKK